MAYIDSVALKLTGNMLSRTLTDMWRGGTDTLPQDDLDAIVSKVVDDRLEGALDITRDELRSAMHRELGIITGRSEVVRITKAGMQVLAPGVDREAEQTREIADKAEMHRVLAKLSREVAFRRHEQKSQR